MYSGKATATKEKPEAGSALLTEDIQAESGSRAQWDSQVEFFLSCLGYAVGFGNIWRFPYLCMRNGGGAFLIPYFVSLFLCGMPLFCLELTIGQFSGLSPLQIWEICPLFKGLGVGMVIISGVASIYFNVILSWTIYYLIKSFTASLPWSECGHSWNTPLCLVQGSHTSINATTSDGNVSYFLANSSLNISHVNEARIYVNSSINGSTIPWKSPAEEFWQNSVLEMTEGIEDLGGIKWDLFGTLLLTWIIVFLCLCKGVKSLGKVVYVTATVPYVFITALLIRGATLPGAIEGIKYYIIPDWSKLLEFQIWAEAMLQIFYTLGTGWGGLITMASYNKFHNNLIRDAILVPVITCLTSFYAGFVMFSVIGFMAHEANLPVKDVVTSGPGMAFVVYPEAISKMPVSLLWAICFFCMLLAVGLDSQFGTFETVVSSIVDQYPQQLRKYKIPFTALVCLVEFVLGIALVTRGGMYVFQIIDWYIATSVIFVAVFEIGSLAWIYGYDRLYHDIELMTGSKPCMFWKICWCVVSPLMLVVIMFYTLVCMKSPTYGEYSYPWWGLLIGWVIAVAPIVPLPIGSVYCLLTLKGSFVQRVRTSLKPSIQWGPADPVCRALYKYHHKNGCTSFHMRQKTNNPSPDPETTTQSLCLTVEVERK